jgi:hypothetical protein
MSYIQEYTYKLNSNQDTEDKLILDLHKLNGLNYYQEPVTLSINNIKQIYYIKFYINNISHELTFTDKEYADKLYNKIKEDYEDVNSIDIYKSFISIPYIDEFTHDPGGYYIVKTKNIKHINVNYQKKELTIIMLENEKELTVQYNNSSEEDFKQKMINIIKIIISEESNVSINTISNEDILCTLV